MGGVLNIRRHRSWQCLRLQGGVWFQMVIRCLVVPVFWGPVHVSAFQDHWSRWNEFPIRSIYLHGKEPFANRIETRGLLKKTEQNQKLENKSGNILSIFFQIDQICQIVFHSQLSYTGFQLVFGMTLVTKPWPTTISQINHSMTSLYFKHAFIRKCLGSEIIYRSVI